MVTGILQSKSGATVLNANKTIADVIYRNSIKESLVANEGFQHCENKFMNKQVFMSDAAMRASGSTDAVSIKVILNNYFAANFLGQNRQLYEDFNFQEKKPVYQEMIKMKLQEGMCLTALGAIQYDSQTGQVTLTNLLGFMAGGLVKAKEILRDEIKNATCLARISTFLAISSCSLGIYVMF